MKFEWDPRKAASSLKKHDIDFADAVTVFDDLNALTNDALFSDEDRFTTISLDAYGQVLVVIYAWRKDTIRIISRREKQQNVNANSMRGEP